VPPVKKGLNPGNFVVRAWGLPRRGKPDGAISVRYGPSRLSYGRLDAASRHKPCEKLFTVKLLDSRSATLSKADRTLKDDILKLKPDKYYQAMSDPKIGLRTRAVLQSAKQNLNAVWVLLQDSLREIQNGYHNVATGYLHRTLTKVKEKGKWEIYDHLLFRFAQWALREIKRAKHVLSVLGLTAQDVSLALPSRKRPGRRLDCAQLVSDKLYTTGMAFRPMENPLVRRITELGMPVFTSIPLGLSSCMSRSDGPEGYRRNVGTRVARTLYGKTSPSVAARHL